MRAIVDPKMGPAIDDGGVLRRREPAPPPESFEYALGGQGGIVETGAVQAVPASMPAPGLGAAAMLRRRKKAPAAVHNPQSAPSA